jgi:hypothetical protein
MGASQRCGVLVNELPNGVAHPGGARGDTGWIGECGRSIGVGREFNEPQTSRPLGVVHEGLKGTDPAGPVERATARGAETVDEPDVPDS